MTPSSSPGQAVSQAANISELQEAIRKRAQEIYEQSGKIAGRDLDNWKQAEAEILSERGRPVRRSAVLVDVDGVQYVGEYDREACDGYSPGEFGSGDDITVRFEGDRMFVTRPNGRELETRVVKKIG